MVDSGIPLKRERKTKVDCLEFSLNFPLLKKKMSVQFLGLVGALQRFARVKNNRIFSFIRQAYLLEREKTAYKSYNKILFAWIRRRNTRWHTILTAPPVLAFSLFGAASKPEAVKELSDEELAIIESDKLFDNNAIDELYDLLSKHRKSKNADILWRLARAARNKAELCKNFEDKKAFTFEALEFAKQSVELDDKNFACHKWYGITLSNAGDFEGTKVKIQNAYKIRDEFQKAIKLNSTDPTCRYLLGLWCFTFADMPWYQHKIAAAIFSTPPSSTYQEAALAEYGGQRLHVCVRGAPLCRDMLAGVLSDQADLRIVCVLAAAPTVLSLALDHFEMAEAIQANFFSKNHLMIGKTNLRMKKKEEAKLWLSKAANCTCKTVDDEQAKKEAEELLNTL